MAKAKTSRKNSVMIAVTAPAENLGLFELDCLDISPPNTKRYLDVAVYIDMGTRIASCKSEVACPMVTFKYVRFIY